jgi:hypothetical protein
MVIDDLNRYFALLEALENIGLLEQTISFLEIIEGGQDFISVNILRELKLQVL